MRFLFIIAISAGLMVLFSACTSVPVKYVKPGMELSSESGYIAIIFANEIKPISFGSRNVYAVLRQEGSNKRFYIPFGSSGEPRLIAAAPGNYRIEDFVFMTGLESVKGNDSQNKEKGVLYSAPRRSGTSLSSAGFSDDYCKGFMVNSGEIIYIGDYSWKGKFAFVGTPVTIDRSVQNDDTVFSIIREVYPDIPASMKLVSIVF